MPVDTTPEPPLQFVFYISRALVAATPSVHNDILDVSQRNNRHLGVTGFLHREGDLFAQYLEGAPDALDRVMERILHDTRHENLRVLQRGPLDDRILPDWQMGYAADSAPQLVRYISRNGREVAPSQIMDYVAATAGSLRFRHVHL
jgi:hypothetical protein